MLGNWCPGPPVRGQHHGSFYVGPRWSWSQNWNVGIALFEEPDGWDNNHRTTHAKKQPMSARPHGLLVVGMLAWMRVPECRLSNGAQEVAKASTRVAVVQTDTALGQIDHVAQQQEDRIGVSRAGTTLATTLAKPTLQYQPRRYNTGYVSSTVAFLLGREELILHQLQVAGFCGCDVVPIHCGYCLGAQRIATMQYVAGHHCTWIANAGTHILHQLHMS